MTQTNYLTAEGEQKLKAELEELKGPRREELSQRLRSAIQMGDLSENADYHKAKEDQGFLEGRIQEIEAILRNSVIIEKTESKGLVTIGSKVTIQEEGFDPETYHLVGPTEADPRSQGSRPGCALTNGAGNARIFRRIIRVPPSTTRSGR